MQKQKRFKLNPLAAGVALALAAGGAHAAIITVNPEITLNAAGASALRLSFGATILDMCNTTADSKVVFQDSTSGSSYRGYYCTLKTVLQDATMDPAIAGKRVFVWKRDKDGSSRGVQPVALGSSIERMKLPAFPFNVNTAPGPINPGTTEGCVTQTTSFADAQGLPSVVCPNTVNDVPRFGLSDVEPALFVGINKDSDADPDWTPALAANVVINNRVAAQAFGVAVSKNLYDQLQLAQGLTDADDLPGPNQPSLSAAEIRAYLSGAKRDITATLPGNASFANTAARVCRRVAGSGSQAASNAYFMEFPCNTAGLLPATNISDDWTGNDSTPGAPPAAADPYAVIMNSSSGNVVTCLNDANTKDVPAIGVLSLENRVGSNNYRYVKIDGMSPNHDVNGNSITAGTNAENFLDNFTNLAYDFGFEFTAQYHISQSGTNPQKLWDEILSRMTDPAFMFRTDVADAFFLPGLAANPLNGYTPSPDGSARPVMRAVRLGNSCGPWAPELTLDPDAGDDAS